MECAPPPHTVGNNSLPRSLMKTSEAVCQPGAVLALGKDICPCLAGGSSQPDCPPASCG
jgi:hypothetical protein